MNILFRKGDLGGTQPEEEGLRYLTHFNSSEFWNRPTRLASAGK